jgi:hypothetical protein
MTGRRGGTTAIGRARGQALRSAEDKRHDEQSHDLDTRGSHSFAIITCLAFLQIRLDRIGTPQYI